MVWAEVFASVTVGLIGGIGAGLLGVSPGGPLVVLSVLLLGAEQHVAQGLSLLAQVPPTSLSGIRQYWQKGSRSPLHWLLLLAAGFVVGGVAGALAAAGVAARTLQWAYVLYLAALEAMLVVRRRHTSTADDRATVERIHWAALLLVGAVGGFSSGFIGIGGGLAITVGLSAGLRVPQHQAQMISLILALLPTTVPAVLVYWRQGWVPSWPVIVGVVLGLYVGTTLGALVANPVSAAALHRVLIGVVAVMTGYMAYKALS